MQPDRIQKFLIFSLSCFCIALWGKFFFSRLFPAVLPLLIGTMIAALLQPLINLCAKKFSLSHSFLAFTVPVCFFLILASLLAALISLLWNETYRFLSHFPDFYKISILPLIADFFKWLSRFLSRFAPDLNESVRILLESLQSIAAEGASRLSSAVFSFCGKFVSALPVFFMGFAATIFCSVSICFYWEKITKFFSFLLSQKYFSVLKELKRFSSEILRKGIFAFFLFLSVTFLELSAGLWILHQPHFFRTAALISLLDLLPVLGVGTVLIPWGIFSLLNKNFLTGFGLLILFVFITVVRNFLEPKIIGDCIGLPPIVSLLCFYIGFQLAGIWGAVLFPILALLIQFICHNQKLFLGNKKETRGN